MPKVSGLATFWHPYYACHDIWRESIATQGCQTQDLLASLRRGPARPLSLHTGASTYRLNRFSDIPQQWNRGGHILVEFLGTYVELDDLHLGTESRRKPEMKNPIQTSAHQYDQIGLPQRAKDWFPIEML